MNAATGEPDPIHATAVAIEGRTVLLTGASGSGKSDLALRLIDRGAVLVSDDYTCCTAKDGRLFAAPPGRLAGRMEVRHIGIIPMTHLRNVPVALLIRLDDKPERMPEQSNSTTLQGVAIPTVALEAFAASAPIKVELALRYFGLPTNAPRRPPASPPQPSPDPS